MKNKYGNVRVKKRGFSFSSKLESAVHDLLLLREKAKEISNIRTQCTVELTRAKIKWRADFMFTDNTTGEDVIVEAKGSETERWLIIYKLLPFYSPCKIEIWKGNYRKPSLYEIINPELLNG